MAEETPWWRSGTEIVKVIKELVVLVGATAAVIAATQSKCNGEKADHVISQNDTQLQKTQDIAVELNNVQQKTAVIEHKAAVIDAKLPKK